MCGGQSKIRVMFIYSRMYLIYFVQFSFFLSPFLGPKWHQHWMTLRLYQPLEPDHMEPAKKFAEKKMERFVFSGEHFLVDTAGVHVITCILFLCCP